MSPERLNLNLLNVDRCFSNNEEPISFIITHSQTTIGEFQSFIKDNEYTGYPHKFLHVIVINGNRILLDELMSEDPKINFYQYLIKSGSKCLYIAL